MFDALSRSTRSAWLTIGLGCVVSLACVWLVARDIDLTALGHILRTADHGWILLGLLAVGVTFLARAKRWAILLAPIRHRAPAIVAAMLIGQTLNFLLPVRVGDIARSVALGRAPGSSVERVLGSVAVEKMWDWISLAVLISVIALAGLLPEWFLAPAGVLGITTAALLIALVFSVTQRSWSLSWLDRRFAWLPHRWRQAVWLRLNRLVDGMESLGQRKVIYRVALWSAVTWLAGVVNNAAVMRAFGVRSWPAAMFLMAVLMVGVALPPSIAALGVFEALTVLALGVFKVPGDTALAVGLTLHVVVFAPPALIGPLLAAWDNRTTNRTRSARPVQSDPVPDD